MTEREAIQICAILFHIEYIKDRMAGATLDEFRNDPQMPFDTHGRLDVITGAIDEVDEDIREEANGGTWNKVRDARNEFSDPWGSVDVESLYDTLNVSLPIIEAVLRQRIAASIFDCEEIHERIGVPTLDRDIGTDRERKDRRRNRRR